MSYQGVPSSSFSAGRAVGARELTAREEQLFEQRRRQSLVALLALALAVPAGAYAFAHLATQKHVDMRTKYFGNGSPQVTAAYVDGKKHGPFVEYFQNSKKKAEGFYFHDVEDGLWTTWFYNGVLESRGAIARGLRHGPLEKFYPSGEKKSVEAYDEGTAHGRWVTWFENGQIESEQTFVRGLAHGRERHWYEDGALAADGTFDQGFAEGVFSTWDERGRLTSLGRYVHGHRDGEWKLFEEGELVATELWARGDLVQRNSESGVELRNRSRTTN